jgi:hypothetical protein
MKEEMSIDELLNSFLDGELTARQETEVRRLIDNDPQVARQFQRLQKCKMLISSLPTVEIPHRVSVHMKDMLEAETQSGRNRLVFERQTAAKNLLRQRIMAVAAMIGFVAVLTAVIFTITPPKTTPEGIEGNGAGTGIVAAAGFHGRLELETRNMNAVDEFVKRTIEDNGISELPGQKQTPNRYIHVINCSQKGLDRLLADLDDTWDQLDSAKLLVDTEVFGEQVVVNAVTTEQIAKIADQQTSIRSIEVARDYAALNSTTEQLPGGDIYAAIENRTGDLVTITKQKPFLTKRTIDKPQIPEEGEKTIHLTIVVSR